MYAVNSVNLESNFNCKRSSSACKNSRSDKFVVWDIVKQMSSLILLNCKSRCIEEDFLFVRKLETVDPDRYFLNHYPDCNL